LFGYGLHADAIDWAGRKAQFAAGAFGSNDGVHVLSRAQYSIDRASLYAQRAPYACGLIDESHGFGFRYAVFGIQWFVFHAH
jgi:hypothetical protein